MCTLLHMFYELMDLCCIRLIAHKLESLDDFYGGFCGCVLNMLFKNSDMMFKTTTCVKKMCTEKCYYFSISAMLF